MRRIVYMSLKYDMSSSRFVVASVGRSIGTSRAIRHTKGTTNSSSIGTGKEPR